jgi:hypothetical protein
MDFDTPLPDFNTKSAPRKDSLFPSFNNKYISSSMEVVNINKLQEVDNLQEDVRSESARVGNNTPGRS